MRRNFENLRQFIDRVKRRKIESPFQIRDIRPINFRVIGEFLLAKALLISQFFNYFPKSFLQIALHWQQAIR